MTGELDRHSAKMLGILRIVVGLLFFEHGLNKLFGWPPGIPGQHAVFSLFGAAGLLELIGGTLMILGLFTRAVAFVASGEMAFAYWMVHAKTSFFPSANGGDAAILDCFIFLYFVFAGSGPFALDRVIGHRGTT